MNNSVGAVIFSRLDSCRLPEKALISINNKKLIDRVYDRCKLLQEVDHTVLSTSDRFCDSKLINHAVSIGLDFSTGPLDKLNQRAINACKKFNFRHIVRICGDRPLFSTLLVDLAVSSHLNTDSDFTYIHVRNNRISQGLTTEVLNLEVLNRYQNCDNEHMTESFYNDPEVKTNALDVSPYWEGTSKDKKFVLDTRQDLIRISSICKHMDKVSESLWLDKLKKFA